MFSGSEITIATDEKEIIASGTVFQFEKEDLIFHLELLNFRLSFISDSESPRAIGKYDKEKNELCMQLFNYDHSLGIGLIKPMEIGEVKNKKLYFICRVYTLGEQRENHLVHYTFYIER